MSAGPSTTPSRARPRCSVFIAISLDGFIARRDGRIDWLSIVQRSGEDYGYQRFFDSVGALVMGRNTYETARGFPAWPYAGKRCVVLTHAAPPGKAPAGVELHAGDPAPLLSRLRADGVERVYVDGGAVIRQFLAAGLIDDLTLSIVPIVLGDGLRLFGGDAVAERRLALRSSRAFPSGLVQIEYEVS